MRLEKGDHVVFDDKNLKFTGVIDKVGCRGVASIIVKVDYDGSIRMISDDQVRFLTKISLNQSLLYQSTNRYGR